MAHSNGSSSQFRFVSESNYSDSSTAHPPSSSNGQGMPKGPLPPPPPPPTNLCIAINICRYMTPLAKLIVLAQPLEDLCGEVEREAFVALQNLLTILENGRGEALNVFPLQEKLCRYMGINFAEFESKDVCLIWDILIKLITTVIPPLREIFMGRQRLSVNDKAWETLSTRCVSAHFHSSLQSIEDFIRVTLSHIEEHYYDDFDQLSAFGKSAEHLQRFNVSILARAPEVLAFTVESAHLPAAVRLLSSKGKPPANIRFPPSFNLSMRTSSAASVNATTGNESKSESKNESKQAQAAAAAEEDISATIANIYDLSAIISLEGTNLDQAQGYYRQSHGDHTHTWVKGTGAVHDTIDTIRAIDKNYFNSNDTKKVHPRLLIYTKRGISNILELLHKYVTRAGQLRMKGDMTFAVAQTPENYDEAKQLYEDAIKHDSSLRPVLQERLNSLDQIEKNQRAQSYENQADLILGKKKFKEASDLYKLAMRSAVPGSTIFLRIKEKEDFMMKIISLEIANHLTEKGEECLRNGNLHQSRENFAHAMKMNPSYIHLQTIIAGIDRLITVQSSQQKINEAQQAMKLGRYRHANSLFLEAVALVPEKESTLCPILDSLIILMQGEDALMKQRSGLVALEDKKYALAIQLITEAIGLLPKESITEHAYFLCDRALIYYEMKDYSTSITDCQRALELKPESAIAYLRLGSAQFELELFDEALTSYEKAMRFDTNVSDQVRVKIRQVNTAKEVQQRKERELERIRQKEEERLRIEEKRAKEERIRKEKAEKVREEAIEKNERNLMREEEKRSRLLSPLADNDESASSLNATLNSLSMTSNASSKSSKNGGKELSTKEKAKKEKEKAEKDLAKSLEKERQRAEKEKEKERLRLEREAKLQQEQLQRQEQQRKREEFEMEMAKASALLKEAEVEKEKEKERLRIERERLLAERERARAEKKAELAAKKAADDAALAAALAANPPPPAVAAPASAAKAEATATTPKGSSIAASPNNASSANATSSLVTPNKDVPVKLSAAAVAASNINKQSQSGVKGPATSSASKNNNGSNNIDYPDFPSLSAATNMKGPLPSSSSSSSSTALQGGAVPPATTTKWAALIAKDTNPSSSSGNNNGNNDETGGRARSNSNTGQGFPGQGQAKQGQGSGQQPHITAILAPPNRRPSYQQQQQQMLLQQQQQQQKQAQDDFAAAMMIDSQLHKMEGVPPLQTLQASSLPFVPSFFAPSSSSNNRNDTQPQQQNPPQLSNAQSQQQDSLFNSSSGSNAGFANVFSPGGSTFSLGLSSSQQPSRQSSSLHDASNILQPSVMSRTNTGTSFFDVGNNNNDFASLMSNDLDAVGSGLGGLTSADFRFDDPSSSAFSFNGFGTGDNNGNSAFSKDLFANDTSLQSLLGGFGSSLGDVTSSPPLPNDHSSNTGNNNGGNSGSLGGLGLSFGSGLGDTNNVFGSFLSGPTGLSPLRSQWSGTSSGLTSSTPPPSHFGGSGSNNAGMSSSSFLLSPSVSGVDGGLLARSPVNASASSSAAIGTRRHDLNELNRRLEDEQITDYTLFPAMQTLQRWGMQLFRWAFDGREWVEFALSLPWAAYQALSGGGDDRVLLALIERTGCEAQIKEAELRIAQKILIFVRGPTGSTSNLSMITALETIADRIRSLEASTDPSAAATSSNSLHHSLGLSPSPFGLLSGSTGLGGVSRQGSGSLPLPPAFPQSQQAQQSSWLSGLSLPQSMSLLDESHATGGVLGLDDAFASSVSGLLVGGGGSSMMMMMQEPSSPGASSISSQSQTQVTTLSQVLSGQSPQSQALSASQPPSSASKIAGLNSAALASSAPPAPSAPVAAPLSPQVTAIVIKEKPPLLKVTLSSGQVRRFVEIPAELIGLVIGTGGRKIKELATDSGCKIQFKTSKAAEREGKPGVLELQGPPETVEKAMQMVWELLQSVGREYKELTTAAGQAQLALHAKSK